MCVQNKQILLLETNAFFFLYFFFLKDFFQSALQPSWRDLIWLKYRVGNGGLSFFKKNSKKKKSLCSCFFLFDLFLSFMNLFGVLCFAWNKYCLKSGSQWKIARNYSLRKLAVCSTKSDGVVCCCCRRFVFCCVWHRACIYWSSHVSLCVLLFVAMLNEKKREGRSFLFEKFERKDVERS